MPLIAVRDAVRDAILKGQTVDIRQPRKTDDPRWEIGRDYLLSSRHKARFVCVDVRSQLLHEVDDEQARREVFKDREALFAYWRKTYGTGPLVEVPTWIITVELDRSHKLKLLAADSSHGYTTDPAHALRDAGEEVDDTYAERFSEQAGLSGRQKAAIYEAAWEAQSLVRRLQKLIDDPNTENEQLYSLERRIRQLEKRSQRKAA